MASRIVKITLTAAEYSALERMKKVSVYRFQPMGTAVKAILQEVGENIVAFPELFPYGPQRSTPVHAGPDSDRQAIEVHTPSPARALRSSSSSQRKREDQKKKREDRARAQAALELPRPSLPDLRAETCREIVGHLNMTCHTAFPAHDPRTCEIIGKLLDSGYTVDDFKAVNAWADTKWPPDSLTPEGKPWRSFMLVPSKLYGERFGEWLGAARSNVKPVKYSAYKEAISRYPKLNGSDNEQ